MLVLPRLYPILDVASFPGWEELRAFAEELLAGGATLLQYRNKEGNAREMLDQARALKHIAGGSARLIINDRADLCIAAGFDGCHVGQDDLSPEAVRSVIGPALLLGVSTHNPEQVGEAEQTSADYVAVGPVFQTRTKRNPDPMIGLQGVHRARELTTKPLVAIGGITRVNCRSVIDAGADSVAVIADLLAEPRRAVRDFLAVLNVAR
jgi:thiamine-phosphate pyrophosphorylase